MSEGCYTCLMGKSLLRHQKNSEETRSHRQPAVSGATEEPPAAPVLLVLALGWAAGQAGAPHLPRPCCCGLVQHLRCGPVSRAAVSAHPVHPSQTQLRRWHSLLWGVHWPGLRAAQGLETSHLSDAPLCSCPYVWYPLQAEHHTPISCVSGVPPCALLVSCTSRANLSAVFLDSSLMQLVRIFQYFDLLFLKYQLSEAHIGLMKQVQFLN